MGCAVHVVVMGLNRNVYRVLVMKPDGNKQSERQGIDERII
jgi:hypothetical protein